LSQALTAILTADLISGIALVREARAVPSEEVVFHNGTIFDGRAFLPPDTCVRVAGGRITAVGPSGRAGPLDGAEPVEL